MGDVINLVEEIERTTKGPGPVLHSCWTPASAAANADPIFADIERHRKAWADFEGVVEVEEQLREDPNPALRRAFESRYNRSLAALQHAESVMMVQTKPTSLAGFAALLRYITDFENPYELDDFNKRLRLAEPGTYLPWHADNVLGLHLNLADALAGLGEAR